MSTLNSTLDSEPQAHAASSSSASVPKKRARADSSEVLVGKKQTRNRPQLSCGECRRLKLRCDRVFPCRSCVKRGCAGICPDGILTSGKGTRYILANTEELHEKILQMSERIRELEVALETMQSKSSLSSHPLLSNDRLLIKNHMELYQGSGSSRNMQVDTIADEGRRDPVPQEDNEEKETFFGHTARLEYLLSDSRDDAARLSDGEQSVLPQNGLKYSPDLFPRPWPLSSQNMSIRRHIRTYLPSADEALYICEQIKSNASWQYALDTEGSSIIKLHQEIYSSSSASLPPHRISLFLMVLAIGCLVDLRRIADNAEASQYYQLARAVLCEGEILQEVDINTIQTLFMMTWYLLIFSEGKRAISDASIIMGYAAKLVHIVGLHRRSIDHKLMPDKLQEKRIIIWELMYIDARLSLSSGRPPSFALPYMDCQRPRYRSDAGTTPANIAANYFEWKHSFLAECLYPVIELTVSAKIPEYSAVIRLDRMIREHYVPPILRMDGDLRLPLNRSLAMQQSLVQCGTEIAILQLHRSFFTQALSGQEVFSMTSHYAPSVLATFHSSCVTIQCLDRTYNQEPDLTSRVTILWSNAFSGAIALCLLASKLPTSLFAGQALHELLKIKRIFEQAKSFCPQAAKFLPVLRDLVNKLSNSVPLSQSSNGHPHTPVDDMRFSALSDKTQSLSNQSSSSVQNYSNIYNNWCEIHPSLLSIWDKLAAGHLSVSSDAEDIGSRAEKDWTRSHIADSWTTQHEDIESLIANIHSDPLFGSIHRKQMHELSFQAAQAFDFLSHAPPDLSF